MRRWPAVVALFALVAVSAPGARAEDAEDAPFRFRVETVATGLEVPWALAFLPDGRIWVTERPGRLRVIEDGKLAPEPVAVIEAVDPRGEGGLMDLEIHPAFAENGLFYIAYSFRGERGQQVRVVRYREQDGRVAPDRVILDEIPAARFHAGCRMGFGPDGKLYVTTGDATERRLAQQLGSLAGKTLRLEDDGSVPEDNPFRGREGARPEIWSYGHRNAQGIDWQPGSGRMFQTEHGPSGFDGPGGGDEVNIVPRGANLGWPVVHHEQSRRGMVSPLLVYTPAVAPASGIFYDGDRFPAAKGDFFFGCLRGRRLIRVELDGAKVRRQHHLLEGRFGRLREVAAGSDGAIYFTTSNRDGRGRPDPTDDRVLRLVPRKTSADED